MDDIGVAVKISDSFLEISPAARNMNATLRSLCYFDEAESS